MADNGDAQVDEMLRRIRSLPKALEAAAPQVAVEVGLGAVKIEIADGDPAVVGANAVDQRDGRGAHHAVEAHRVDDAVGAARHAFPGCLNWIGKSFLAGLP